MSRFFTLIFAFLSAAVLSQSVGCATFTSSNKSTLADTEPTVDAVADETPQITVELRFENRKPESVKLPLAEGMHIQQAVEQSGAGKRFRRMKIDLMRPINGRLQKLASEYNHSEGMVDPAYDYALYPGDHLIIKKDPSTIVDDMIGSLGLPMKQLAGL